MGQTIRHIIQKNMERYGGEKQMINYKFVIHPEYVRSKTDSQSHYIGFEQLVYLYGVDPKQCINAEMYENWSRGILEEDLKQLTHLYPRYNGDYKKLSTMPNSDNKYTIGMDIGYSKDYIAPQFNLQQITDKFARDITKSQDNALFGFVRGSVSLLEAKGEDITKYAIIRVQNPAEWDDGKTTLRVTSQWRVVPISQLQNLPTFDSVEELLEARIIKLAYREAIGASNIPYSERKLIAQEAERNILKKLQSLKGE